MILVDFSGICLATILINKENDERMIRHMTLNSLRMYNQKFKEQYGQMVLACDGPNNIKEYVEKAVTNLRLIGTRPFAF